jgi:hypothetical protein
MPSFATLYRAIVMLAAAVIIVKGWQHYGPSTAQMKSAARRVVDLAHSALNESEPRVEPIVDTTAGLQQQGPVDATDQSGSVPQSMSSAAGTTLAAPPIFTAPDSIAGSPVDTTTAANVDLSAPRDMDQLPALLTRLEQLGGIDPQLVAWGSSGQLYRFCCRATLADAPSYTRHFEAIAPEPLVAVENVVAKVEAWRTAQRAAD